MSSVHKYACLKRLKTKLSVVGLHHNGFQNVVIEISGGTFKSLYIPEYYQGPYKRILGHDVGDVKQALHMNRCDDPAFSISIHKSDEIPLQLKPFPRFSQPAKKRTTFVLLENEGMEHFMSALPMIVEQLIPEFESVQSCVNVEESDDVSLTRETEVKGDLLLQSWPERNLELRVTLVKFSSTHLHLHYVENGEPSLGIYISKQSAEYILKKAKSIWKGIEMLQQEEKWEPMPVKERANEYDIFRRARLEKRMKTASEAEAEVGDKPAKRAHLMNADDEEEANLLEYEQQTQDMPL